MTIAETTQELNPRVAAVFTGLIEELARLIREQRITFEEYRQIVGFWTRWAGKVRSRSSWMCSCL